MISKTGIFLKTIGFLIVLFSANLFAQTTVISDPLTGSTKGQKVGGSITSEGYQPGKGNNHILYKLPQIVNGYVEFEVKGFNPSSVAKDEDHGFIGMYDGRGISEPIKYANDFKYNYFRWNFHWRQNKSAFKSVVSCAAPTSARLNSNFAVFSGGGTLRDWFDEPVGKGWSWNTSTWYKVKLEWRNKKFTVSVNGTQVWAASGPYDYAPKDFRIWLGSAPGKYDSDVSGQTFRNFKVATYGGTIDPVNSLAVGPSSQNVSSTAGNTEFSVSSNVSWAVTSNASWLTVSPTSGSNDQNLTASFSENTGSNSRTGTITVKSSSITKTVTVVQAAKSTTGGGNSLTVSPASRSVGASAGNTSFSITSNVSWTVNENVDWLSVSPPSGSNNATVPVSYSENNSTNSRAADITIAGGGITRTVSITQAGAAGTGGSNYLTVPETINLDKTAGKIVVDVKSNVSWRVSDNTGSGGWISKSPKTGTGDGSVTMTYQANNTGSSRTGNLIFVGGGLTKTVSVVQAGTGSTGGGNSLALSPSSRSVGSSSGSTTFSLTSNVSWTVNDNASWLSMSPSGGSNNGNLTATFTDNTASSSRTATITAVGGGITKTVTVVQAGKSTSGGGNFINVPETINLAKTAGKIVVDVKSNVSWRVSDNTGYGGWISKTPKTGTGDGSVTLTYQANNTGSSRTGNLIFVGGGITKIVNVVQSTTSSTGGGGNYINVPEVINLANSSGTYKVDVQSNVAWRVSDNTGYGGWISKTPKTGTGNGIVTMTYRVNTTGKSRTGNLIFVGGGITKTIIVNQSASNILAKIDESGNEQSAESSLAIEEEVEIPTSFSVSNYPNPFNPTTTIQFALPEGSFTELIVYNTLGQVVSKLVSEFKSEGVHSVNFDASRLSSGIYFYNLRSGKYVQTGKMLLIE